MRYIATITVLVLAWQSVMAQGAQEDYERAERFLSVNSDTLVFTDHVSPNWVEDTGKFWYQRDYREGHEFLLVDAGENERRSAFDHQRLAGALEDATGKSCDSKNLPFSSFEYLDKDLEAIYVQVEGEDLKCDIVDYECSPHEPEPFEPGVSPDEKWQAFVEDHNLYVRNLRNGEVLQLTSDGRENYDYATPQPNPVQMINEGTENIDLNVHVSWSPDSRKLVTYRLDQRSARKFTLVQSSPDDQLRPKNFSYAYPLPGEVGLAVAEPVIFHIEERKMVKVDVDPMPLLYYGGGPLLNWFEDSEGLYYLNRGRGYERSEAMVVDSEDGSTEVVHYDEFDTHINSQKNAMYMLEGGEEFLWTIERDGWHHIYRYDTQTGNLINQVTEGEWVLRQIHEIDEENERIHFSAGGREGGDPYFRYVYRVNFDGSDLTLLTPEEADHNVSFSPGHEYFVDNYSRVDQKPVSVLRNSEDGSVIMELEEADIELLSETGWQAPEPYKGVSADGETDIYGVIWKPSNFDPDEEYPVIEQVYTGPHSFFVPKSFRAFRSHAQTIAELGFIVVQIDGRGTGGRSREFREHSFENLGGEGAGIDDRLAVMEQMASDYPYMDLDRVGIYGHSAGGYDSAHSILIRNEFYDVAVSSAGNHDHRMDKAWWNEQWMGYPAEEHYEEQSNVTLADQLEGDLLLVHGELDENVHPAATMQLVDALIDANKDFDMLIMPNMHHGLSRHPYFVRSRWDYFVEHLLGIEPPTYNIESL